MREITQTMDRSQAQVELARLKCAKCGMVVLASPGLNPKCACGNAMKQIGTTKVRQEETE